MDDQQKRMVNITYVKYVGPNTEKLHTGDRGMLGKVPVNNPAIPPSWLFWPNKWGDRETEGFMLAIDDKLFENCGEPGIQDFLQYFGNKLAASTPDLNKLAVVHTPIGRYDPVLQDCFVYSKFEASRPVANSRMTSTYTRFWTNWGWAI